jgi:hypothetical protein
MNASIGELDLYKRPASGAVSADADVDAVVDYLRRAGVLAPATDAP